MNDPAASPLADSPQSDPVRNELDGLVVTMELTLISIIQGVALYWLTDSSRNAITNSQWEALPYVVSALLILLLFWSWSLFHTFTIIRWPLELTHNFGYIVATLIEALMFTQVANPLNWFALGVLYAGLNWFLFARDFRMIRRREREFTSDAGRKLLAYCHEGQTLMVRVIMPATLAFYIVAAGVIYVAQSQMLEHQGHLFFGVAQVVGGFVAIVYIVRLFARVAPLILQGRRETR